MESIDWNACIICNKCDGELKRPVDSHLNNGLEVYRNFLDTVQEFRSLDALPVNVTYEGDNVAELFYQKKARWHKSASKLLRVEAQKKRGSLNADLASIMNRESPSVIYLQVKNVAYSVLLHLVNCTNVPQLNWIMSFERWHQIYRIPH